MVEPNRKAPLVRNIQISNKSFFAFCNSRMGCGAVPTAGHLPLKPSAASVARMSRRLSKLLINFCLFDPMLQIYAPDYYCYIHWSLATAVCWSRQAADWRPPWPRLKNQSLTPEALAPVTSEATTTEESQTLSQLEDLEALAALANWFQCEFCIAQEGWISFHPLS